MRSSSNAKASLMSLALSLAKPLALVVAAGSAYAGYNAYTAWQKLSLSEVQLAEAKLKSAQTQKAFRELQSEYGQLPATDPRPVHEVVAETIAAINRLALKHGVMLGSVGLDRGPGGRLRSLTESARADENGIKHMNFSFLASYGNYLVAKEFLAELDALPAALRAVEAEEGKIRIEVRVYGV